MANGFVLMGQEQYMTMHTLICRDHKDNRETGRLFTSSADISGAVLQSLAFDGAHFSAKLVPVCKPLS